MNVLEHGRSQPACSLRKINWKEGLQCRVKRDLEPRDRILILLGWPAISICLGLRALLGHELAVVKPWESWQTRGLVILDPASDLVVIPDFWGCHRLLIPESFWGRASHLPGVHSHRMRPELNRLVLGVRGREGTLARVFLTGRVILVKPRSMECSLVIKKEQTGGHSSSYL
jgi:hypothetical protein